MAGIWSVQGVYNTDVKKVSSKLNFNTGDNFSARIISKSADGKEVTVKTIDGWQFAAVLEGQIDENFQGMVKLRVAGFENGKLILEFATSKEKKQDLKDMSLLQILNDNDMSQGDSAILKAMLRFAMPLTRENISKVKTLFDFVDKLNNDVDEGDNFIENYLRSKGVPQGSAKSEEIKTILKNFLNDVKSLFKEDILTFIENDIELTSENIKSYNRVVKEEKGLVKSFDKLQQFIENTNAQIDSEGINQFIVKNAQEGKSNISSNIRSNVLDGQITAKSIDFNNIDDAIISVIDELKPETQVTTKEKLTSLIQTIIAKDVKSSDAAAIKGDFQKFVNELANILGEDQADGAAQKIIEKIIPSPSNAEGIKNTTEGNNSLALLQRVYSAGKDANNDRKLTISNIVNEFIEEAAVENPMPNEIKQKLLESVEFGTKIKDLFKAYNPNTNNQEINKTTFNNQVKEIIYEAAGSKFDISDSELVDIIKVFIENEEAINNPKASKVKSGDIFEQIQKRHQDIKEVVKDLITLKEEVGSSVFNSIVSTIKENINDFKVLNSLSDKYYYSDIPLNLNNSNVDCKLIIKDDRKSGKAIDKTNLNMALSVTTENLGTIDAFLKIRNNSMNVDIKCEEKWVKIFNLNKSKLESSLENKGYIISLSVSVKEQPFDLASCREFFSNYNSTNLNVIV